MTVGIAAMAESGNALVLCADRQQTTGAGVRHEGRIAKKRELGFGWRFLYEDSGTRADVLRDNIQQRFVNDYYESRDTPMRAVDVLSAVEDEFFALRGIAMRNAGQTDPKTYEFDLGILLVGYDEEGEASGYRIWQDGEYESVRETGYAAIGEGEDVANATLAHYTVPMDDPLDRVLYKVYEAKRRVDSLITSVGKTTDLWIMTGQPDMRKTRRLPIPGEQPLVVPSRIIEILESVYSSISSPPWERKEMPGYWYAPLVEFSQRVMRGERPT